MHDSTRRHPAKCQAQRGHAEGALVFQLKSSVVGAVGTSCALEVPGWGPEASDLPDWPGQSQCLLGVQKGYLMHSHPHSKQPGRALD